ncbi:MAG TPA: antibiotic biosynthesis monooxygenase [Flavobacteriales bacterium]|nr:antibiotic biosynthesis monooxygenase [Flavobacteriales bacterium]
MKTRFNMGILRIVRMEFEEQSVASFDVLFQEIHERIQAFDGCERVMVLTSTSQANQRTTMSWWKDEASLNAYRKSEFFGAVWPRTKALFSKDPIAWSMDWSSEIVRPI